jgi:hypothetical protein
VTRLSKQRSLVYLAGCAQSGADVKRRPQCWRRVAQCRLVATESRPVEVVRVRY